MDIDYYKKINNLYGFNKKRDSDIERTKQFVAQQFNDDVQAFDVTIEDRPQTVIISYAAKENMNKIISRPDETFKNGEIVTWMNEKYIVLQVDPDKRIYTRGLIKKCLGSLKWQDEFGDIYEAWFARTTDLSPNFGVDDRNKLITMPDERRQIIVQSNVHTQKFRKEQRFIVDGRAWKIITLDDIADGVINLVLEESHINPATDNVDLRVADYRTDLYKLISKTASDINIKIDQSILLEVTAYHNGISVDNCEIEFAVEDESFGIVDDNCVFVPRKVGQVKVYAKYKDNIVEFNILIRDILVHNYSVDIIGSETINFGQTAEYRVVFKNNGAVINETPIFNIEQSVSDLVTIQSELVDQKLIVLKANNKNKSGNVTLNVQSDNWLIKNSKTIRIKGFL